ncbi:LysR family transcriptional regulator [Bradyrhizobium sp. Ai1a-2]|uniref:LysR family transcriptional regulator n=1 Tax=Bradyrhizobium sp. Ai1a-2 TaxID=196490 RepID=UPI0004295D2F|nr:LysR family transcriptional regulator [Bradyrhizobium sp. Ai1a-2]
MDFAAVTAFVHAAELKSFTAAAAKLNLTASAVSKAVSRLETEVGVRLMNRTTRSLSLTADGEAFLGRCRNALAELEDAREMLARTGAAPRGLLRISLPLAYGRLVVVPELTTLLACHTELFIEASFSDRRVDLIEEGYDLAIRIGELPDSRLIARRIDTARFVVCASPGYLARAGRPGDSAALREHTCIMCRSTSDGRMHAWRLPGPDGDVREIIPEARLIADYGEALVNAALADAGLIYIHRYMVEPLLIEGRLEIVLEDDARDAQGVFALFPQTKSLSPRVRAVVDHLVRGAAVRKATPD